MRAWEPDSLTLFVFFVGCFAIGALDRRKPALERAFLVFCQVLVQEPRSSRIDDEDDDVRTAHARMLPLPHFLVNGGLAEALTGKRSACAQSFELCERDIAPHWSHATVGAREKAVFWNVFEGLGDGSRDLRGRFYLVGGHVDNADEYVFALEKSEQFNWHV